MNCRRLLVNVIILTIFLTGCVKQPTAKLASKNEYHMGTQIQVSLPQSDAEDIDKAFELIKHYDDLYDPDKPESLIAKINNGAGLEPIAVDIDTLNMLQQAKLFSEQTEGRFDVTIGPLIRTWGFFNANPHVPANESLKQITSLVNYKNLQLNDKTAYLTQTGMALDLGAIAKGFAADKTVEMLKNNNIKSGIINMGGNVVVIGSKTNKQPWTVGIQDPDKPRGRALVALKIEDTSVVTSGTYERFIEQDGKRYHHILDSQTGYPADTDLLSVTVINKSSMLADALSTSILLLGKARGIALIEQYPDTQIILVTKDKEIYYSPELETSLKIEAKGYKAYEIRR